MASLHRRSSILATSREPGRFLFALNLLGILVEGKGTRFRKYEQQRSTHTLSRHLSDRQGRFMRF